MSEILKKIKATKRDYSEYLYHFTRQRKDYGPRRGLSRRTPLAEYEPFDVLKEILQSGQFRGNAGYAPEECVCFSETPIDEIIWLMSQPEWEHDDRYSFYGVAVKKNWLYSKGGRPVVYQHSEEKAELTTDQLYKLSRFEPEENIDFSWEREWRIKTKSLLLNPSDTLVICASASESKEIMTGKFNGKSWLATLIELLRR